VHVEREPLDVLSMLTLDHNAAIEVEAKDLV
jgi:hypothetical protein